MMETFTTTRLPKAPAAVAPDGTDVRLLLQLKQGSFAHFELAPGRTSFAVAHRTIEEIWFFLAGRGQVWRRNRCRRRQSRSMQASASQFPSGPSSSFVALGL